eukprot:Colp12_sorted_trinity150504_noHs@15209
MPCGCKTGCETDRCSCRKLGRICSVECQCKKDSNSEAGCGNLPYCRTCKSGCNTAKCPCRKNANNALVLDRKHQRAAGENGSRQDAMDAVAAPLTTTSQFNFTNSTQVTNHVYYQVNSFVNVTQVAPSEYFVQQQSPFSHQPHQNSLQGGPQLSLLPDAPSSQLTYLHGASTQRVDPQRGLTSVPQEDPAAAKAIGESFLPCFVSVFKGAGTNAAEIEHFFANECWGTVGGHAMRGKHDIAQALLALQIASLNFSELSASGYEAKVTLKCKGVAADVHGSHVHFLWEVVLETQAERNYLITYMDLSYHPC